jgi:predicted outer membrane protein
MIRKLHTGILLAASAGLAGAMACGANAPADTSESPARQQQDASADAASSANLVDGGDAAESGCSLLQITDCSTGQIVAIAQALNTAEIDDANLAIGLTSNPDVRSLANRILTDHTNVDRLLSAWLDASRAVPVASDISNEISRSAANELATLRRSSEFDRDFVAHEVVEHVTALGFFEHVLLVGQQLPGFQIVADAQPGSNAALATLLATARIAIQTHLQLAFVTEQQIVGACGTGRNDGGAAADAGNGADAGNSGDAAVPPGLDASDASDAGDASDGGTPRVVPDAGADAFFADVSQNPGDAGDAGIAACDEAGLLPDGARCPRAF